MNALAERVRREGNPLVDGETVTFVWLGDAPPQLVGDWNRWSLAGEPLSFVEEFSAIWTVTMQFAPDSYIEYRYVRDGTTVPDPLNRWPKTKSLGDEQHHFWMPEASETRLIKSPRGDRGSVSRHVISGTYLVATGRRTVWLYDPPVEDPVPLLVVLDGQDYVRRARLPAIVDNLIAERRIEPIALAMVQSAAGYRYVEYAANDATIGFLKTSVLPLAADHLNLQSQGRQAGHGILGASMGGLLALYAGLRMPDTFRRVVSQSGAFGTSIVHHPLVVNDLVDHLETPGIEVWMDCGRYEWLLEPNREMHRRLLSRGVQVAYREFSGGHNWTAWRNDIAVGLEALFGPQP